MKAVKLKKVKYFLVSMLLTLLFCLLIGGFIVVNISSMAIDLAQYNLDNPVSSRQNGLNILGYNIKINSRIITGTKEVLADLSVLVPAPLRLLRQSGALLEAQSDKIANYLKGRLE